MLATWTGGILMMQPEKTPAQKGAPMKIRKLADAAIVAALLMTSIPDIAPDLTPGDLLTPPAQTVPVSQPAVPEDDPASRELS